MKRVIVTLILALACAAVWHTPARAAVTYGNSCTQDEASGDTTTSCTINSVAAGSAIITCVTANGADYNKPITFTDDKSGSYASTIYEGHDGATFWEVGMSYAVNAAGGNTVVTVTIDADQYRRLFAIEAIGIATSSPLDDSDHQEGSNTAVTSPAMTASVAGAAFGCTFYADSTTVTEGMGWTLIAEDESFTNSTGSFVRQNTTAGSYTPTWTIGTNVAWVAAGVILKEATSSVCTRSLLGVGC